MKICYIGDARSVHLQRWVAWFAERHDVRLVRTSASEALGQIGGPTLPGPSRWPGWRLVSSVGVLGRYLKAFQPDLLHAHYINEAGWFGAASRWRPFVLTAWGSDVYQAPRQSCLAAVLNPWAARRADRVTCDSEDQRGRLEAWGVCGDRLAVRGWGVDTTAFRPGLDPSPWRRRLDIPDSAFVVFSPRQWLANSNIEAAVHAHERLGDHVYLLLKRLQRFESPYALRLERLVASSPARARIRIVSEVPEHELPNLYAAADCLLTLCGTDGTPVSVLEGMAVGLPIVALGIPSLREWVAEPGGVVTDSLDPALLASALLRFIGSADARRSAATHNVAVIASRASRDGEMRKAEDLCAALVRGSP